MKDPILNAIPLHPMEIRTIEILREQNMNFEPYIVRPQETEETEE